MLPAGLVGGVCQIGCYNCAMRLIHPAVVIDWNFVRSSSVPEVPAGYQCLVCDQMFHEIAHITDESGADNWEPFCVKAFRWARDVRERLWVARIPSELFELEKDKDRPLRYAQLVHEEYTEKLRHRLEDPNVDWVSEMRAIRGGAADNEKSRHKDEFVGYARNVAEVTTRLKARGKPVPEALEDKVALISNPEVVVDLLTGTSAELVRRSWREHVLKDVNRYARARWIRINFWYAMNFSQGRRSKFENNYDDAVYALLASYTGHLATHDRRLRQMTSDLFPGLRVLPADLP